MFKAGDLHAIRLRSNLNENIQTFFHQTLSIWLRILRIVDDKIHKNYKTQQDKLIWMNTLITNVVNSVLRSGMNMQSSQRI